MIDPGMFDKELMEYFRDLSPSERKSKLDALKGQDEEVMEFCRELYHDRYTDPKKPENIVDNWLWKIVYLPGLYAKKGIFRRGLPREAEATIQELHLDDTDAFTDTGKTILYLEFRNAAKRYLSTCDSDGYGTTFFGLKKGGPEQKKAKAAEDIWRASRGIAIESGETEKLEIWCAALRDELFQYDSACKIFYEQLESKFK